MAALTIKQVHQKLKEANMSLSLPVLYSWAKSDKFQIGEKAVTFAGRIGNRWVIQSETVEAIIHAVNRGERVGFYKESETRGRKPGTKFGSYRRRR